MEMLEELEKDFNTLANKIDFKNYDPLDPNFMKASVVGLMWLVGGKLCRGNDIEEELEGAENYFHMYEESGDPDYKEMSLDELKHAGILLKKHMRLMLIIIPKKSIKRLRAKMSRLMVLMSMLF